MRYNTDPHFVGYEILKTRQREQLESFEDWAAKKRWRSFHDSHYDWWMFPIDEPSRYGNAWVVYDGDISELKKDEAYIRNYLRGVELLALSWGWNLYKCEKAQSPQRDQCWQGWPIRLYKASKSLKLFGLDSLFDSMKTFAKELIDNGENMGYNGRDLSLLFR
jgi:hypothetical protein